MPSVTGFVGGIGRVRLSLDLAGSPTPTGGEIRAVATLVNEQNSEPVESQNLEFYLGADRVEVVTGDDGRATHTFPDLGFGTHMVQTRIVGVYVTQRYTFAPQVAKIKPIKEPLVHAEGVDGKCTIHVACVHDDGSPAADVVVKFITVAGGQPVATTRDTDGNGFAEYAVNFREAERKVVIHCRGFQKEVVLRGPSGSPKPPPVPVLGVGELRSGRLARLFQGWRSGAEALREQRRQR